MIATSAMGHFEIKSEVHKIPRLLFRSSYMS
jgi:hypothetical protein